MPEVKSHTHPFEKRTINLLKRLNGMGDTKNLNMPWMKIQDDINNGKRIYEKILLRVVAVLRESPYRWDEKTVDKVILILSGIDQPLPSTKSAIRLLAVEKPFYKSKDLSEDNRIRLRRRVLQAVNFQNIKLPKSFWKEECENNPKEFGPYAFAGIRISEGPDEAYEVLNMMDLYKTDLANDVYGEFRGWIGDVGTKIYEYNFEEKWNDLKEKYNIKLPDE